MSNRSRLRGTDINYRALKPYTPYITTWSEEDDLPVEIIERPGRGIAYVDETLIDRDNHGVLWYRTPSRPGEGEPMFAKVHPLRQRRAMRRLLCNVCASPADRTDDGILWLLRDHHDEGPGWPENLAVTEPPICVRCVPLASRLCPALRKGAAAIRVRRAPVAGVRGLLYRSGGRTPVPMDEVVIGYEDPGIRWVRAINLVRELHDCTLVPLEELCRSSTVN